MITRKSPDQIALMRRAGRVVAEMHEECARVAKPGATTMDVDRVAREVIDRRGARSNFLGYHGFPAVACISPNEVIVHGIPGDRILGLSKFERIVDFYARRAQTQERLTKQVAEHLQAELAPYGVGVVVEAEHTCMSLRGAKAEGSFYRAMGFCAAGLAVGLVGAMPAVAAAKGWAYAMQVLAMLVSNVDRLTN